MALLLLSFTNLALIVRGPFVECQSTQMHDCEHAVSGAVFVAGMARTQPMPLGRCARARDVFVRGRDRRHL